MKKTLLGRAMLLVVAFFAFFGSYAQTAHPTIYGSLRYSYDDIQKYGLMRIDAANGSEPELVWQDYDMVLVGSGGAVYVDGLYYALSYMDYFGMIAATYVAADPETMTWKSIGDEMFLIDYSYIASDMTYDATTGNVYACSLNGSGDGTFVLSTMDLETSQKTAIAPMERLCALAADSKGLLYGIDMGGKLYKVDKATAELELIGWTGVVPDSDCSATFDPATDQLYWSAYTAAGGELYVVDTNTAEATLITTYPNGQQITGIFIKEAPKAQGTPQAVEASLAEFADGALQGKIRFALPWMNIAFGELTEELTWTVSLDDETVATGKGMPGDEVEVNYKAKADGKHRFTIKVANTAGESAPHTLECYIGNDQPQAPQNLVLVAENGKLSLTWETPEKGANGGYVDNANLTHEIIRLPEGVRVAADFKGNSFSEELAVDGIKPYYYQLKAKVNGYTSEKAESNIDTLGNYFNVPFKDDLMDVWNYILYTSIDGNGDDCYWTWGVYPEEATHSPTATYMWGLSPENDDWLVSPALYLEKGKDYTARYSVYGEADEYAGVLSAWVGTAADTTALTTQIMKHQDVDYAEEKYLYSDPFQVKENGLYHVGLHVGGARTHFYIYVTELHVTETPVGVEHVGTTLAEITQQRGVLSVRMPQADQIQVVSMDGRVLHQSKTAETRIPLAPGVYVVKAGGTVQKVWMK